MRDASNDAALIGPSVEINDPAHPDATAELRHDLLYRVMDLVPAALFVWALFSARQSFAGVGRGDHLDCEPGDILAREKTA